MSLREVQSLFLELVTAPEGVAKTLDEREARGERGRADVAGLFAGDERMSAEDRLDVYANMYFFRLRDVLAEDFARTAGALGEARWHNLVTDYLLAHPPTRWSLRWAGEELPGFLRGHAYGAERPWLADVAALEWARNEAFQARDAEPVRAEALSAVAAEEWPALTFGAAPGAVAEVLAPGPGRVVGRRRAGVAGGGAGRAGAPRVARRGARREARAARRGRRGGGEEALLGCAVRGGLRGVRPGEGGRGRGGGGRPAGRGASPGYDRAVRPDNGGLIMGSGLRSTLYGRVECRT